ncbi:MAG: hypothetical protein WAU91_11405 [Desulfatitalea sp.]
MADGDTTTKWFKVDAPAYDGEKRSYFRMGAPDPDFEENFLDARIDPAQTGWVAYTDGDRFEHTGGDHYVLTEGDEIVLNEGWFNCEMKKGINFESFLGYSAEVYIGGKYEANISANVAMNLGLEVNYGAIGKYESVLGGNIVLSGEIEQEATRAIRLSVDPDDDWPEIWFEKYAPWVAGGLAGVTGLVTSVGAHGNADAKSVIGPVATGLSGLWYGLGLVNAYLDYHRRTKKLAVPDKPRSEILMDTKKIELKCSAPGQAQPDAAIVMDQKKIELKCGDASILLEKNKITLSAESIHLKQPKKSSGMVLTQSNLKMLERDLLIYKGEVRVPDKAVHAKEIHGGNTLLGK